MLKLISLAYSGIREVKRNTLLTKEKFMSTLLRFKEEVRPVVYNPGEEVHLEAYLSLTKGKQSNLRFILEDGYPSIISMMERKNSDHHVLTLLGERPEDLRAIPFNKRDYSGNFSQLCAG